jgi:hypothetical protein
MNTKIRKLGLLAMAPAVLLATISCHKSTVEGTEQTSVTPTTHGVIVVETYSVNATVTAIDASKRDLTLTFPDGKTTTFKATPDMVNFPQIQVGDEVKAVVTEQAAVSIRNDGRPPSAAAAGVAVLTPVGAKPGGVAVATWEVTATVVSVDASKHKVTLQFVEGKPQTLKVSDDVNLANVTPGESLVAEVTEGVAISVEKQ